MYVFTLPSITRRDVNDQLFVIKYVYWQSICSKFAQSNRLQICSKKNILHHRCRRNYSSFSTSLIPPLSLWSRSTSWLQILQTSVRLRSMLLFKRKTCTVFSLFCNYCLLLHFVYISIKVFTFSLTLLLPT